MASRIAIAYDCLFPHTTGGGERLYRAYAEQLVALGRDVEYLTARQWSDADHPPERFAVRAVCGPLHLYDSAGVRRTPAAAAFAWALFRSLVRRRGTYDAIIVSGLPVLNVFAVRAALLGSGTRVVVDYLEVWGRAQWRQYAGGFTGVIAWMLQTAAVLITPIATCHSRLTAQRLRAAGFRGRLLLSPGLIDGGAEHPSSPIADQPPFVLYAGRHIPDKRVDALPAAVARARRDIPGLRLVVLGTGPSTDAVRRAVDAVDGSQWTDLPGFVSQEQLNDLMASAACLANPSQREGYGLVVVESAAHGTPVVLVDGDDNAAVELIDPGENGFTAPSADPDDLGAAIAAAVTGGDDLRRTTRAWYDVAVRERTVQRTVGQIVAALSENPTARRTGRQGEQQ